ncbi:MAG: TIGR00282 family metallophosphoesterase [Candidatus Doudnabacteria bacterium CG10_big_fil_rev_8_21_14_0_10_41_10]|uniref:TIGR00282 family metallophosphoesterase n=1 Tax=Candidatus Doudnabacteria bacterium CG10_big_fil_rev_8_21_14_0_10_41_10 TaxID=1974551 RepID=A0A2H0VCL1_9BACT|nr:MAG: TIGR00282 family metallophosphoesterase [Candidatus Doudnabacteria bacterium CG10_big_fil_rev_8_21_14_0_10_41_10]
MKILFFGDIVGRTGRIAITKVLPRLKKKYKIDLVVANGENAAHGTGLTLKTAQSIYDAGVDFITSGNHIFRRPEQIDELFAKFGEKLIRPMNFEGEYSGEGWGKIVVHGKEVIIANFHSQVFMETQFQGLIASPFKALDNFLQDQEKSAIIIVDFHSEATSEKRGFGFYADGRVTAVIGTHTHVQTADAQVLPKGTAYISDVGMCGSANSILGVDKDRAIQNFLGQKGSGEYYKETEEAEAGFVVLEVDGKTGKVKSIKSFLEIVKV